ncbi:MAG: hypothetical protein ACMUIG_04195 [Thermoplasmatota archaeon]
MVSLLSAVLLLATMNIGAVVAYITVLDVDRNLDFENDYSYFDVQVDTDTEDVPDGWYPGWCAQRNVLIGNDWPAEAMMWNSYDPTHPFQSYDWPEVVWLVNEYDSPTDYEFPYLQMAIWGILGYNYLTSEYAPVSLADQAIVDGLITAAATHDDYMPSQEGDVWLYIIYVSDSVQRVIIEVPFEEEEGDGMDDTAWAYGSKDTELWDLKGKNDKPLTNKWGWYFMYEYGDGSMASPVVKEFWAGAGQNDLSKGWEAGEIHIWNSGGTLYIKYVMDDEVYLTEAHVYAGEDAPDTAAPGQFPYKAGDLDYEEEYAFTIDDLPSGWDELYVAVHGVAWYFE